MATDALTMASRETASAIPSGLFMKRVVFTLILAAFIFTVVMIFVFLRMGSEPSTLIENVFRFLSVEGGAMALIKSVKQSRAMQRSTLHTGSTRALQELTR